MLKARPCLCSSETCNLIKPSTLLALYPGTAGTAAAVAVAMASAEGGSASAQEAAQAIATAQGAGNGSATAQAAAQAIASAADGGVGNATAQAVAQVSIKGSRETAEHWAIRVCSEGAGLKAIETWIFDKMP